VVKWAEKNINHGDAEDTEKRFRQNLMGKTFRTPQKDSNQTLSNCLETIAVRSSHWEIMMFS